MYVVVSTLRGVGNLVYVMDSEQAAREKLLELAFMEWGPDYPISETSSWGEHKDAIDALLGDREWLFIVEAS